MAAMTSMVFPVLLTVGEIKVNLGTIEVPLKAKLGTREENPDCSATVEVELDADAFPVKLAVFLRAAAECFEDGYTPKYVRGPGHPSSAPNTG